MSSKRGHTRTCVGCRRAAEPVAWQRIAATKDGIVRIGVGQPGRGAWVCSPECFDRAVERAALARALRCRITSAETERLRATLFGPATRPHTASAEGSR